MYYLTTLFYIQVLNVNSIFILKYQKNVNPTVECYIFIFVQPFVQWVAYFASAEKVIKAGVEKTSR